MNDKRSRIQEPQACTAYPEIGCVIMASGLGKRFGGNKLLADLSGKPLFRHILETCQSVFSRLVVVTRHKEIYDYCQQEGIRSVLHDFSGRNHTVRLGLEALLEDDEETFKEKDRDIYKDIAIDKDIDKCKDKGQLKGVLFCQADQPLVSSRSLRALAEAADKELIQAASGKFPEGNGFNQAASDEHPEGNGFNHAKILRLGFQGQGGAPVLFPAWTFPELMTLPEGKGGGVLLQKYSQSVCTLEAGQAWELMDVDSQEDLKVLQVLTKGSMKYGYTDTNDRY